MNNKAVQILEDAITLCCWCGIPLGSANTVEKDVCLRCHTLLINAGITDEEIFSDENTNRSRNLQINRNINDH